MLKISVSPGNTKLGAVPSVSLPPVITCKKGCLCGKDGVCYALRICRIRPSVCNAYTRNFQAWNEFPEAFELQVKSAACTSRFFRWHVSGDIVNMDYLKMMVRIARELPMTQFLAFTKQYEIVNQFMETESIPENLKLIFSAWPGMDMPNPHELPVANVIFKGEQPAEHWKICGGNCTECACQGVGCWELKKGEEIAFYEH